MREVYKYKARLNVDGSQMQPGRDYDLTYAPVASWESILSVVCADPEIQMQYAHSERHCHGWSGGSGTQGKEGYE
jgi:hypothetical protein